MKFLSDAQTNIKFVELLRHNGHEVFTVYEQGLQNEKRDWVLVAYARSIGCTFLTFDLLRSDTGVRVGKEIRENGGKVLIINGGPDQLPEKALGRFYFHLSEWLPFLEKHDGRAEIGDLKRNPKLLPRSKMYRRVTVVPTPLLEPYITDREESRSTPRQAKKRPRQVPANQSKMDYSDTGSVGA